MKGKQYFIGICKVLLILFAFVGVIIISRNRPIVYDGASKYTTVDVVYADGQTAHFDSKNFGTVSKGDLVTLHVALPEKATVPVGTLVFYDYSTVTEVWYGDTLLDSHGQDSAALGRLIGNHVFFVDIPSGAWGEEITIILRPTEINAFTDFPQLKIYPSQNANQWFIDNDSMGFVITLALFTFSILGALACILGGIRGTTLKNGLYLVLLAFFVSLWLISNRMMYSLFRLNFYFWEPLEYTAGFLIAVPVLLFYRGMTNSGSQWRKIFGWSAIVVLAFSAMTAALNFTNILHYSAFTIASSLLLAVSSLLLLVYSCLTGRESGKTKRMLRVGSYVFVSTCLYELLFRSLVQYMSIPAFYNLPTLITLGIMFLLLCMIGAFISDLYEKQKELLTVQIKADTLDQVIAEAPAGICQLKPDDKLTIVSANDSFYKLIGYRDDELESAPTEGLLTHLLEDEKVFVHQKVEEILQGGDATGEFELTTVDIDERPLTVMIRYFYDRDGSGNITVNIIDITDRKRMEEELRIREEDYRTAIEASDHYYFNYDPVTKTCTHMFDSEELFGVSEKVENIPESLIALGLCAPESIEDYRKAFRMFADGIPGGDFCLHLQNIKTHKLRWYGGGFRTIFDANGKPLHAIVAFKDVTEQREKEIAYNIHRQQIESHSADEITYYELNLTTGTCDYHYGAEAEIVLKSTSPRWDDMVAYAVDSYVCPEDKKAVSNFMHSKHLFDLQQHGITEAAHEYRGYRPDGDARWLRVSVSIAVDDRTREVKAYCSIQDIEAEKVGELKRQAELEQSRYYEEAYEKLSSSVMYGVCKYTADDSLSIVFANDIFYQMHGYASQEEAVAAGFTSVFFTIPPFGKDMVRAAHREYMEGKSGQLFETEYPTVDAGGNKIWILCRGIYSPEEGIFNSSVLNITDRKLAEEQLRVSEERYRLALNQSGKVFFFFDVPTRTMSLSQELADAFGLPLEVDNMPDNFLSQGLVEPESEERYRHFYERILSGEASGDTIISCHMRQFPENVLWYKIAFTSVFGNDRKPMSAIITYEDLQEQRAREIEGAWKQLSLLSVPQSRYVIAEYDLTKNRLLSQKGGLFAKLPDFVRGYDEINSFVLERFVYEEDVPAYRRFLDRARILAMFDAGKTEDSIEYRSLQSGSTPRWTATSIQLIRDAYSGDVLAQLLFMDIHEEKSGQIEVRHNMESLQKELDNSRIKVMINQMQPHFLYNALSSIQILIKRDPDRAYTLIRDFTVHLRGSIKALSSDKPIPFTEELRNVRAYLNIEMMRLSDNLRVEYDIACEDFMITPLSIQPLAENAVKHGVFPKGSDGGTITLRSYETDEAYVVEVQDDGVGFDINAAMQENNNSYGLKNLVFRLKSLMNAEVAFRSEANVGTLVTVRIPKGIGSGAGAENDCDGE